MRYGVIGKPKPGVRCACCSASLEISEHVLLQASTPGEDVATAREPIRVRLCLPCARETSLIARAITRRRRRGNEVFVYDAQGNALDVAAYNRLPPGSKVFNESGDLVMPFFSETHPQRFEFLLPSRA